MGLPPSPTPPPPRERNAQHQATHLGAHVRHTHIQTQAKSGLDTCARMGIQPHPGRVGNRVPSSSSPVPLNSCGPPTLPSLFLMLLPTFQCGWHLAGQVKDRDVSWSCILRHRSAEEGVSCESSQQEQGVGSKLPYTPKDNDCGSGLCSVWICQWA